MNDDASNALFTTSSNVEFASAAYRAILGREPDEGGAANFARALDNGILDRAGVLKEMAESGERWIRSSANLFGRHNLHNLIETNSERYGFVPRKNGQGETRILRVQTRADYDWIERHIYEDGFYETMGGWILSADKAFGILADQVCDIGGKSILEIGCSNGQILGHLKQRGWDVNGVEISHLAVFLAPYEIRKRIFFGDLLDIRIDKTYDVVMGLDVFEHLNPFKIPEYIRKCADRLNAGGFLYANIPMFGQDRIFGTVFSIYLDVWDASPNGLFEHIEVDEKGWPEGGHLGWALPNWWEAEFAKHGLVRNEEKETLLHRKYAAYFAVAPARKSFFVLKKS